MEQELLKLLEILKGLAPEIYKIYVRQATTIGWVDVVIGVLALVGFVVTCRVVYSLYIDQKREITNGWHDHPDHEIAIMLWSILGGVLLIATMVLIPTGIMYLANPQYYAIQALLGH